MITIDNFPQRFPPSDQFVWWAKWQVKVFICLTGIIQGTNFVSKERDLIAHIVPMI